MRVPFSCWAIGDSNLIQPDIRKHCHDLIRYRTLVTNSSNPPLAQTFHLSRYLQVEDLVF